MKQSVPIQERLHRKSRDKIATFTSKSASKASTNVNARLVGIFETMIKILNVVDEYFVWTSL